MRELTLACSPARCREDFGPTQVEDLSLLVLSIPVVVIGCQVLLAIGADFLIEFSS